MFNFPKVPLTYKHKLLRGGVQVRDSDHLAVNLLKQICKLQLSIYLIKIVGTIIEVISLLQKWIPPNY